MAIIGAALGACVGCCTGCTTEGVLAAGQNAAPRVTLTAALAGGLGGCWIGTVTGCVVGQVMYTHTPVPISSIKSTTTPDPLDDLD